MRRKREPKIILGIDCGYARTGYGVISASGQKLTDLDHGCIETEAGLDFADRLLIIEKELTEIILRYQPRRIAIEKIFFSNNQKTGMAVSQARGVILITARKHTAEVLELTPLEIKKGLTGFGQAPKSQMQTMVKVLLGLHDIPKPDDAADALAAAIVASNNLLI